MNPLPECCFPHSAPIPHQFVMKVYVDAWIYVTEKFVNMGNIELYEGVLRYEKADYPPIPSFILRFAPLAYCCILYQCLLYTSRSQQARGGRQQKAAGAVPCRFCVLIKGLHIMSSSPSPSSVMNSRLLTRLA